MFIICSTNNDFYFNKPNNDEQENKSNESTFNNMMTKLEKHQKQLAEIRGCNRLDYTKYMTKAEVFDEDEYEDEKEEKEEDGNTFLEYLPYKLDGYQFGYRYYYWNYYKAFDEVEFCSSTIWKFKR